MLKIKKLIWIVVFGLTILFLYFIGVKVIIPAYKSPLSRIYYSRYGYPTLLRYLEKPIPVEVATSTLSYITEIITAEGHTVSEDLVYVNSKIIGRVQKIYVSEGSIVKSGELLVKLDSAPFENELMEAKSILEIAETSLRAISSGERSEIIRQNEIAVERAKKVLEISENRYMREKELYRQGLTSKTSLEDYEKDYLDALAVLLGSEKELEKSKSGRIEEIEVAKSRLDAAHSRLKIATQNLDATAIHSPIDGVVIEKNVNIGEITGGIQKHMIVIASGILFRANVDQEKVGKVYLGQEAEIILSAYPGIPIRGIVRKFSPATILYNQRKPVADNVPVTFPVWISLIENIENNRSIISGMTGFSQMKTQRQTLIVPTSGIIQISGTEGLVFIVEDAKVSLRKVVFGMTENGRTEIIKGIELGETVVISGQNALKEGDVVEVKSAE